ncbi:MAG: MOSC domain-containing protein [Cytophagales bacterium]|nr:MOSC domain-containing protein [Cytophagales bacterium]
MKVISTNIGKRTSFQWNGEEKFTGINKKPVDHPIHLGKTDVVGDVVIERVVHAGPAKACYLYSADHYPYWKNIYPNQEWHLGMFGENLTVEGLDETTLYIGNVYQVGSAKIVITEPRQPCYKFGFKMGDQGILKKFINTTFCGSYIGVLEEGEVNAGDEFILLEESPNELSIAEVFKMRFTSDPNNGLITKLENETALPEKLHIELLNLHARK